MRGKGSRHWLYALLLGLAAGAGHGQNNLQVIDPLAAQPGGTSLNDDAPLKRPRLYWKNGEFMDGDLVSADDHTITFQSDLFAEPAPLWGSELSRVDFPPAATASAVPAFSILLKNGDCLYSDIVAVKTEGLQLRSERHGEMLLPLASVQSVRRLKTDRILYSGPQGAAGWAHYGLRDVQGFPWSGGEHGAMMTRVWNRSAMMPLDLPETFEADVVLASTSQLRFSLSFGQASNSAQHMAIETWDDELVIAQANRFQPLRTLKGDDHVVALRICWDRKQNHLRVHDWSGVLMGEFQTEPVNAAKPCVLIRNKGAQLVLEQLSVRVWDGGELVRRDASRGWIEKTDGSLAQGVVKAGADGQSLMVDAEIVPLTAVTAFDAGPEDAARFAEKKVPLPQMLIAAPRPEAMPTRMRYGDGTLLSGDLAGISNEAASLRSPLFTQPLMARLNGMSRLLLNEPRQSGTPAEVPLAQLDTLHVANSYLHGKLEGTGDASLRWRLPAAVRPVAIAKRNDVEVRRPVRDVPSAPALFFLKDGNVLGAKLQSVADTEVRLSSDIAELTSLKPDQLNAIHFNSRKLEARGFGDAGWQSVRGEEHDVERKGPDKILIKGAGAFGHATILAGDEVSFTMSAPSFWAALAVELFAGDMETHSKSAQLHLIFSGSDFWTVLETGDNNSRSSEQLRNLTRKDVEVRLLFSEDTVQVFANGIPVMSNSLDASLRKGPGIIFSGSGMWGSPTRDVEISNFAVNARPDFLDVPHVGDEARHQALTIPRARRTTPPTHVLLAPNGDLLRGRMESATAEAITFTSGLDSIQIPTERVTAAVWLDKPKQPEGTKETAAVKTPSKDDDFARATATHWLLLQDGSRLALKVDKFEPDRISGWSASLGSVSMPFDRLAVLKLSPPPPSAAMLAYVGWQPEFAQEPVLPETGGQSSPLLGKAAPDFVLPLMGGGQFNLSAQKGKVIVLDFWATWCGPCVASIPEQLKAMSQFDSTKVQFIAVNQGEPEPQVAKFLQVRGWQMMVALDGSQDVGRKYGADSIPHCVVVGPDGKVVWVNTGYTPGESEKMAAMIKKLIGM